MIYVFISVTFIFIVAFAFLYNKLLEIRADVQHLTSEYLKLRTEVHELTIVCYQRHSKRSDAYVDYPNSRR